MNRVRIFLLWVALLWWGGAARLAPAQGNSTLWPAPEGGWVEKTDPARDGGAIPREPLDANAAGWPANLVSVAQDIAEADLDANGFADLLVVGAFSDSLAVIMNPGAPIADPAARVVSYSVGMRAGQGNDLPRALALGDFNKDRRMDVAVVASGYPASSAVPADWKRSSVTILLGQPGGGFIITQTLDPAGVPGAESVAILALDFNADGALDLVTLNQSARTVSFLSGDGFGRFQRGPVFPLPYSSRGPRAMELLYRDDGQELLILQDTRIFRLRISTEEHEEGELDLNLEQAALIPARSNSEFTCLARGDFNGDGAWDLAVGDAAGGVVVYQPWADQAPQTAPFSRYRQEFGEVISLAARDWDGSGRDSLAIADHEGGKVTVYNPGDGAILATRETGPRPRKARFSDWRRRGLPDVLTANEGESAGLAGPDLGLAINPLDPPNSLGVLGADSSRPWAPSPSPGRLRGIEEGPDVGRFCVAAPDRGALLLMETPPAGYVWRQPRIVREIPAAASGCLYPVGVAFDSTRQEWLVTSAGSNRVFRFDREGRGQGWIEPQFDPGAEGFSGVAVHPVSGAIWLSAPGARMIVEIRRGGQTRAQWSTGAFPAMDLAYSLSRNALLASHPSLGGWREYPVSNASLPEAPPSERFYREISIRGGDFRVEGLAVRRTGGYGYYEEVSLLANGHVWSVPAASVFHSSSVALNPRSLMVEGLRGTVTFDRDSGAAAYLIPPPCATLVEFAAGEPLGRITNIEAGAMPLDGGFEPGTLGVDPTTRDLLVADSRARGFLRLRWPDRLPVGFEPSPAPVDPDSWSASRGGRLVGMFFNRNTGAPAYVFSTMAVGAAAGSDGGPLARFPLGHLVHAVGAARREGAAHFLSGRDGWIMTREGNAAEIPARHTSLTRFLPPGFSPVSIVEKTGGENTLFVFFEGQAEPLALRTGEVTAAGGAWRAYE